MRLDLFPEAEILLALEPDELRLRIVQVLGSMQAYEQKPGLGSFINIVFGNPQRPNSKYSGHPRSGIEEAIREAWAWLEGQGFLLPDPQYIDRGAGPRVLSRRAARPARDPDPRLALGARRLHKDALHPTIREDVWALYHRGKYDTAVFEAMKAVEVAVREAAGLAAKDIGYSLMRTAFDVTAGALTDTEAEPAERQARSDLFAGAIGSYKNPHSHRNVALDDPDEAAEIIMPANHLLRIVDARREARTT